MDWTEPGVLPHQDLFKAIEARVITARDEIPRSNVQPASLDLRLGSHAHRMRCSFLPDQESVASKLKEYLLDTIDIEEGAVLEPGRPYLIPLMERLDLPETVKGRANPKSSTGRVDVFTRVISDRSHRFDDIRPGYKGPLYLEVVSRSFSVRVKQGLSLNQLRLSVGDTRVDDAALLAKHQQEKMVYDAGGRKVQDKRVIFQDGLFLTLDLRGDDDGFVGYRARHNSQVLDLAQVGTHRVRDFWEPVFREHDGPRIVLEPDDFYLLISRESVRVPADYASEMSAFAESAGELRSHYAGFFDPGFGHGNDPPGSRAVLEVRARDVPFMVEQSQPVCKLTYETMRSKPAVLYGRDTGSNYQGQIAMLSKHFDRDHTPDAQLSIFPEIR